jgi:hypothetical protein
MKDDLYDFSPKKPYWMVDPPELDLPKVEPFKIELPEPTNLKYDDPMEWNRRYGYHHTLGPQFGPKFNGGSLGV